MNTIFDSWAGLASHFIGECFDLAKPYINSEFREIDHLVRFVAAQLFIDCHLSSESSLLLVQIQKEWDADLVARAVMEGSFKFVYMVHGTPEEVRAKVLEYWEILPRFAAIRRGERAQRLLDVVPDPNSSEWKPFRDLILPEAEISKIRKEFTRQERQALEEKWSFAGMCREFAKSQDEGLSPLVHLAHQYGMSTHVLHKDGDGVGMVWDRFKRTPERQTAAKLAHAARIVSDVCTFSELRLTSLLRMCVKPTQAAAEIRGRYGMLFSELEKANAQFTRVEYGASVSGVRET